MTPAAKALAVLVLTDHVRAYLFERDPKALAQAVGSLMYTKEGDELNGEQKAILRQTDDLLIAKGVRTWTQSAPVNENGRERELIEIAIDVDEGTLTIGNGRLGFVEVSVNLCGVDEPADWARGMAKTLSEQGANVTAKVIR